jgi:hypothetical protein
MVVQRSGLTGVHLMMISTTKRKGWYPQVKYVGPFFTATANMKSGMSATEPD